MYTNNGDDTALAVHPTPICPLSSAPQHDTAASALPDMTIAQLKPSPAVNASTFAMFGTGSESEGRKSALPVLIRAN